MRSRMAHLSGHVLIAGVLTALVLLVGRLVYINTHDRPSLVARAVRQQTSVVPLMPRRGLIVDCRGRIISGTLVRKSVFADPQALTNKDTAIGTIANILGIAPQEVGSDLLDAGDRRFLVIRRGVDEEQAELIKNTATYGLGVFNEPYRVYPMNTLGSALIGFVSPDGGGVSGLEYQCDTWLRGESGLKTIVRDARRKAFWLADGGYRPARDGFHVVLTIDSEIQAVTERELGVAIDKYKAESGVAIVMNPNTGAVLAMANMPAFDPNNYGDFSTVRYRNRAITDPYEPGSTFKPFIAVGALQEKVVSLGEVFNCEHGEWTDGARTLRDHHPYDYLSFEEVIIKSSNIGMAKIGKRMGNEQLNHYVRLFGFGQKTGLDILGEDPGIVRPFSRWNSFTTTSIPMGQEIGVTPIQMARAFSALSNGGRLITPYVIKAVMDADGRVVSDFTPTQPTETIMPAQSIATMKDKILTQVVNIGSGTAAKLSNYQVFGKTGTAQIAKKNGRGYEPNAYVSSFIAGAPARNPQLVVFVAVRRPNKSIGYYGGKVAAPVVSQILRHALAYLEVPPDPVNEDITTAAAESTTD